MGGWGGETLSAEQIGGIFQAAEDRSILEVTLTGGEITATWSPCPSLDRLTNCFIA